MSKVVCRFEKVSFEEFRRACLSISDRITEEHIKMAYDNIKLPERSTKRSSGYDFYYAGHDAISFTKGESVTIPTGVRCVFLEDCYDLSVFPRSGMGFKYRVHLDNTVGIIDNDYADADNEGHIMIKLSCDPRIDTYVSINPGTKFAQGIIREFFLAEGDEDVEKHNRKGGMGSTGE